MKKISTILMIIIIFLSKTKAQFGPLTQLSDIKKNYNNDCTKCSDPWVGELYYKIWGTCAATSGDACNIKNWNNGSWTNYENLKNIIRGKYTQRIAKGNVYIFVRHDAVQTFLGPAGHIGWGFELSDGSYYAGSTENPMKEYQSKNLPQWIANGAATIAQAYWVSAGQDNGFWSQRFANAQDMLYYMKNYRNYDRYKVVSYPNPNLLAGKLRAEECMLKGFQGVSNNCLDQTYYVLEGLGLQNMPWKQTNPTPNGWFDEWYKDITNHYGVNF
ncbi:MAG: hypothetical protein M3004_07355 [Bacteroidota bacterium]|nr:hypothetical protein [Bacteroidota bacterium]